MATICAADPWGQFRCCWMHTSFLQDSRFFYMVLEPLGCSLHEFTKKNDYRGFWLQPARPESFPREEFCEVQGDEVLCKKKRSRPVGIKIIDFGNTVREHDRREKLINTRQYRGPGKFEASDDGAVWEHSVGQLDSCIPEGCSKSVLPSHLKASRMSHRLH